jgi:hypothetical protein
MTPLQQLLLVLVILVVLSVVYAFFYRRDLIEKYWFLDKRLLERGTDKPALWLFVPTSEVNSRHWLDFGNRSSRALNVPLLNLCYQTIVQHNHPDYHVRIISGVSGLADLLGQDALPSLLKRHGDLASLGVAEMNWIRAAVLARFGGLWLNPSVICIRPFGKQPDQIVFFGTDPAQTLSGPNGTTVASNEALWVPKAQHPIMIEWEQVCFQRVNEKRGGEQFRGDWGWDFIRFTSELTTKGESVIVDPHAELSRKRDGKRIQLEDLFATGTEGRLPFDVPPHAIYCPIPWEELQRREVFGWALRMSEEQVMESDISVKYLLQASMSSKPSPELEHERYV